MNSGLTFNINGGGTDSSPLMPTELPMTWIMSPNEVVN